MPLIRNTFSLSVILIIVAINLVGCGKNMVEAINVDELKEKWDDSANNSSESWWYAGSEKKYHFIAIKRPYSSVIYQLEDSAIGIEGIELSKFSDDPNDWVNIKMRNITFYNNK